MMNLQKLSKCLLVSFGMTLAFQLYTVEVFVPISDATYVLGESTEHLDNVEIKHLLGLEKVAYIFSGKNGLWSLYPAFVIMFATTFLAAILSVAWITRNGKA